MKKILALVLSLLMAFAVMPMVMVSANDALDIATQKGYPALDSKYYVKSILNDHDTPDEAWNATGTVEDGTAFYGTSRGITSPAWNDTKFVHIGALSGVGFRVWIKAGTTVYSDISIGSTNSSTQTTQKNYSLKDGWNTVLFSTYGISTENASKYAYLKIKTGTAVTVYVDEVHTIDVYKTASFSNTAVAVDPIKANEDDKLTLPTATLAEGEFAGWITEDEPDTVIPAGTEVTLTKDTEFFAVSSVRGDQEAPDAPVVESKSSTSVTLVANSAYQYSMDGVTWQNSNVFSGLKAGTEYTFYQRLKATATKYASPASAVTKVETSSVYKWNIYSTNFTISNQTMSGGFNTQYQNDGTYFVSTSVAKDNTATFTSKETLKSGVYSAKIYARAYSGRASINISINGTVVAENLNTSNLNGVTNLNLAFPLDSFTVTEEAPVVIEITATSSGSLYLNAFEFEKIGDYVATETDGLTTDAIATADKASIRLNEVNGMRFFTTVDTEKLAALGTVTEMGTLIGPKNKIGDYLTMDDATAKNAVAVEYGVDNDLWEGNEFVGSIVNVKDTNLNREFVARGYVKVGDTYYYSSTTSTRTLAGVADSCIADTDYYSTLDAATQALVNTWAAAND